MPLWGHPRRNVEREEDKREKHFDITMDDWMTVINTGHIFCGEKEGVIRYGRQDHSYFTFKIKCFESNV